MTTHKFYTFQHGENSIQVARKCFAQVMKIPDADGLSIPVAHRIGPKSNKIRPLLVTLPVSDQFAMIMCHTKYLAGTGIGEILHMSQHEKSPLWIQSPEETSGV
ncbi:hypothetical protein LSH36_3621g00001 [Paralvinella palmiformis]|jgi:hypothetical protein|uniref:Uncharacterized protein n=2 Tax=Paralvinella palmiformis TaxID=53620 RepID=A0AAD9MPH9_9ANNE|nr:hypothetical protein LSH36_3621g00001 [Paralvinella palmiformis]